MISFVVVVLLLSGRRRIRATRGGREERNVRGNAIFGDDDDRGDGARATSSKHQPITTRATTDPCSDSGSTRRVERRTNERTDVGDSPTIKHSIRTVLCCCFVAGESVCVRAIVRKKMNEELRRLPPIRPHRNREKEEPMICVRGSTVCSTRAGRSVCARARTGWPTDDDHCTFWRLCFIF